MKRDNKFFIWLSVLLIVCFTVLVVNGLKEKEKVSTPAATVIETIKQETENKLTQQTAPTETTTPAVEETKTTEPDTTLESQTEPESEQAVVEVPFYLDPNWTAPNGLTNREMLAIVIYQEAGGNGSCDKCRYYVGDVVLNRVESKRFSYADSIDDVLLAYRQYGMFYKTGIKWPSRASNVSEKKAVARAYKVADDLLAGNHSELYGEGYIWQAEFKQGKSGFWCCGTYYGK